MTSPTPQPNPCTYYLLREDAEQNVTITKYKQAYKLVGDNNHFLPTICDHMVRPAHHRPNSHTHHLKTDGPPFFITQVPTHQEYQPHQLSTPPHPTHHYLPRFPHTRSHRCKNTIGTPKTHLHNHT